MSTHKKWRKKVNSRFDVPSCKVVKKKNQTCCLPFYESVLLLFEETNGGATVVWGG